MGGGGEEGGGTPFHLSASSPSLYPPLFSPPLPPLPLPLSSFPLPPSSPSRVRGVLSQSRCGTTISMVFNMTSGPSVLDPSQWTSSLLSWQKPSPTLLVGTQLCSLHTEGWHSSGEGGGVEEREMVREMGMGRGRYWEEMVGGGESKERKIGRERGRGGGKWGGGSK